MDQQHAQALADPMMSSYEAFDMAATAFVSYTTVSHQQTLVSHTYQLVQKIPTYYFFYLSIFFSIIYHPLLAHQLLHQQLLDLAPHMNMMKKITTNTRIKATHFRLLPLPVMELPVVLHHRHTTLIILIIIQGTTKKIPAVVG